MKVVSAWNRKEFEVDGGGKAIVLTITFGPVSVSVQYNTLLTEPRKWLIRNFETGKLEPLGFGRESDEELAKFVGLQFAKNYLDDIKKQINKQVRIINTGGKRGKTV